MQLMIGREPDLTILIDMDPAIGLQRALSRQTSEERFEDFGQALQVKMRQGFLELAGQYPDRFQTIDGGQPIEAVAADILRAVEGHLP